MILVTGGLGFIGSHTTRALLDAGADVLPASRTRTESPLLPPALNVARIDCTDPGSLSALDRHHRITTIVHLAAAPLGHDTALAELRKNTDALLTVLTAAARWNVERVVVASSIGVYAGVDGSPWREDAPLPVASPDPIPAAKKSAEILALASGLNVIVARIGGIWGPMARPTSPFIAAPALIHAAANTRRQTVGGDAASRAKQADGEGNRGGNGGGNRDSRPGEQGGGSSDPTGERPIRADEGADILYAPDCGRALARLATADGLKHRVYNIGAGRATTNRELAAAITETSPSFRPNVVNGSAGPLPYLDTTRIRNEGWNPQWPLSQAAADYLSWLESGHER